MNAAQLCTSTLRLAHCIDFSCEVCQAKVVRATGVRLYAPAYHGFKTTNGVVCHGEVIVVLSQYGRLSWYHRTGRVYDPNQIPLRSAT